MAASRVDPGFGDEVGADLDQRQPKDRRRTGGETADALAPECNRGPCRTGPAGRTSRGSASATGAADRAGHRGMRVRRGPHSGTCRCSRRPVRPRLRRAAPARSRPSATGPTAPERHARGVGGEGGEIARSPVSYSTCERHTSAVSSPSAASSGPGVDQPQLHPERIGDAAEDVAVGGEVGRVRDETVRCGSARGLPCAAAPASLKRLTVVESPSITSPGSAPSTPAARTSPTRVGSSIQAARRVPARSPHCRTVRAVRSRPETGSRPRELPSR